MREGMPQGEMEANHLGDGGGSVGGGYWAGKQEILPPGEEGQ